MADGTLKVGTITTSSGSGTITLGQSGETVNAGTGVVSRLGVFESQLLHVRDEKSAGTEGGTASAGNNTLTLNTVLTNEITGASLSSNQITLPSGTYYIEASGMAFYVDRFKLFLKNVTDNTNTIIGQNGFATNGVSSSNSSLSHVKGRFTIASQKVFSLVLYCEVAKGTNGLGVRVNDGATEVYHQAQIWRTA